MRRLLILILGFGSCLQLGCTTVRVEGAIPSVESYLGIVKLDIHSGGEQPLVVQTTAFGLTLGARSTNIGWLEEQFVATPNAGVCQIFVFPRRREEAEALRAVLAQANPRLPNVCILGGTQNDKN